HHCRGCPYQSPPRNWGTSRLYPISRVFSYNQLMEIPSEYIVIGWAVVELFKWIGSNSHSKKDIYNKQQEIAENLKVTSDNLRKMTILQARILRELSKRDGTETE